jgi:hypothetical protein
MGWYTLPKPGDPIGPCKEGCKHRDCIKTRDDAKSKCSICNEEIGFDVKFYYTQEMELQHALCVWEENE